MRSPPRRALCARASLVIALLSTSIALLEACTDDSDPVIPPELDAGLDGAAPPDATTPGDAQSTVDAPVLDDVTIPDSTVVPDASDDGEADATDDAPSEASSDATPSDAESAAQSDAALDAPADAADAADAAPPTPEKISAAACPWSIAIKDDTIFWSESTGFGCLPQVRSCATSGCALLTDTKVIYSGTVTQSVPMGVAAISGAGPVFFADNQFQHGGLWRSEVDGGTATGWGGLQTNGAAVVTDGTWVYWGGSGGLFRAAVSAAGLQTTFSNGNFTGAVENGPHTIALDGTNVYGASDKNVRSCPLGTNCGADGGTVIGASLFSDAGASQLGGLATDGTNIYFTSGISYSGGNGPERLARCPVTGCPGGVPEVMHERTTTMLANRGSHFGVAVDANNVYFSTVAGTIEYCAKNAAAPCTPTVLASGVRAFSFAIDGPYLYWADMRNGIYRIVRP
jgi:hypothetical protein